MEKYRLDKTIENEKLQIQINYEQYKEARINLRKLLDERKIMETRMNEKDYKELEIQDYFDSAESTSSKASDQSDEKITSLHEANQHLTKQLRMLQIIQETQMVKMIDVMNDARKAENERTLAIDGRRKIIEKLQEKE